MAITGIKTLINDFSNPVLFINTEFSGNNKSVNAGATGDVSNCWVPWCLEESQFPSHHIQIIDMSAGKILWYIWQFNDSDGDKVRATKDGYKTWSETVETAIKGDCQVGVSINLRLGADGGLKAEKI